jgi:hypothetical protein
MCTLWKARASFDVVVTDALHTSCSDIVGRQPSPFFQLVFFSDRRWPSNVDVANQLVQLSLIQSAVIPEERIDCRNARQRIWCVVDERRADDNAGLRVTAVHTGSGTGAAQRSNVAHRSVLPQKGMDLCTRKEKGKRIRIRHAIVGKSDHLAGIVGVYTQASLFLRAARQSS